MEFYPGAIALIENPAIFEIVAGYNRLYPLETLEIMHQVDDVFVLRFDYYYPPTQDQLDRLNNRFSEVEVIEFDDSDCGTLYPLFVKLKPELYANG